eukprot:CAMPEP_0170451920 /NCGR_PEP_ID=MMETSP0123-20130129/1000_1 /TAXON_ID=182087 /ORGANISM="Favella ehrenbergii, Strain Fehren 1" /LENGTH=41 /DNA_ID= /DNA_START= /DNA_END= /DNA_ORIENTATION=
MDDEERKEDLQQEVVGQEENKEGEVGDEGAAQHAPEDQNAI